MFCQKRRVELFCGSAFCSAVSFFSLSLFLSRSFLFFFTLNRAAKKEREKKEWKINREAQSDPIVSMRFSLKHLRKSIWVAEEWDQTVPSHFWSCQFKVPIEQRERGEGSWRGGGVPWLVGYRHLALTFCLRSCPLKVGLFSLSHSEAQGRATVWLTANPLWYLY